MRYGSQLYREWVYNEANIDGAKVVWAREMDTAHNRKLLEYFADRCVWLLVRCAGTAFGAVCA